MGDLRCDPGGFRSADRLADGRPVLLSTSREPYDLTTGALVVLPEGEPHAGALCREPDGHDRHHRQPRRGAARAQAGDHRGGVAPGHPQGRAQQGRPEETADIVVPAAHCEIVYEIPINR
ncbi:hypothetical protein TNCT6_19700 [Streptomyces sp. 6-11-2]|nr:hypothetical protein TNCT6_19700 [Streptomyces sp. 6-11-2]